MNKIHIMALLRFDMIKLMNDSTSLFESQIKHMPWDRFENEVSFRSVMVSSNVASA